MAYDARTIANEFLKIAKDSGHTLTNMQLQKLVYIAHGWSLALLDRALLEEPIEAWKYGPVIPSLYRNLRKYGAGVVSEPIPIAVQEKLEHAQNTLLDSVWKSYGQMSAYKLSTITHQENTPWSRTVKTFGLEAVIPEAYIADHYRQLYDERIRRKRKNPQPANH